MRKFFIGLLIFIVAVVVLGAGYGYYNSRDRHPGYAINLNITPPAQPQPLRVGFAALKITPYLPDRWTDKNQDAAYNPGDGDTYTDGNNNGEFDAYWMAGFGQKRAANGVHDDLWARVVVVDDGQTRLAIVAVDLIGFPNKNVINVRKSMPSSAGITYTMVCSTHTHEAPDFLGMWGGSVLKSGVNKSYERFVEQQITRAVLQAATNLRPARLRFAQDLTGADSLLMDTRKPLVTDSGLYIMQALDAVKDSTLGTLVVWGNHPETLWSKNLLLTSDFPHYVRHYLEKGIMKGDSVVQKGLGGTVVYASGCVGGLMTTSPKVTIQDPLTGERFKEPTFEKADAQGKTLAMLIYNSLQKDTTTSRPADIRLKAQNIEIPLANKLFKLAVGLGILDAGYSSWGNFRSEIAAFQLGEASFLCVPGEIYPEIVNGGIENPVGADFRIKPMETPPLRSLMKGKYKFVIGLANDELGYIIPKSEWDTEAPHNYNSKDRPYGEVNSTGPETAPKLYRAMAELLRDL